MSVDRTVGGGQKDGSAARMVDGDIVSKPAPPPVFSTMCEVESIGRMWIQPRPTPVGSPAWSSPFCLTRFEGRIKTA